MPNFDTLLTEDQAQAIQILITRCSHILAMGTGLGKTYTLLAAYMGVKKVFGDESHLIVVGPKNTIQVWEKEINKRTPFTYEICSSDKDPEKYKNLEIPDVVISEFNALPKAASYLDRIFKSYPVILVIDEYHKVKNPEASLQKMVSILKANSVCVWGSTACPTKRVLIPTRLGIKSADKIAVGDYVFYEGREYLVKGNGINGKEEVLRVDTEEGYWTEGNLSHPVRTREGWKFLKDLRVGDEVELTFNYRCGGYKKAYPLPTLDIKCGKGRDCIQNKSHLKSLVLNEELASVLGWLVADGYLEYRKEGGSKVGFVFNLKEVDIKNKIKFILESWGYRVYERVRDSWIELSVSSIQFAEFMKNDGISESAKTKQIPFSIWTTQTLLQKVFLKYLFSADGTITVVRGRVGRIAFSTESATLADDVHRLLGLIGIKSIKREGSKRRDTECVVMVDSQHYQKFLDEVGFCGVKNIENVKCTCRDKGIGFFFSKVSSIRSFEDNTYAIEVEGGVYNTNCIVSHNTPMLNHIEDLFHLVDFIFPGRMGTLIGFLKEYTTQVRKEARGRVIYEIVGYKNLDKLHQRIKPFMFIRYPKIDVRFHEEIIVQRAEEEELYLQAAAGTLGVDFRDFVGRLPDLQLVVDNAVKEDREYNQDYDYLSAKEERFLDIVGRLREENRAVIVYSGLRKSLMRVKGLVELKYRKAKKYMITGTTSQKLRSDIETQFSEGDFLFITGAGGESLNLQVSNAIVMYNLPFKVGEFVQVVGRIARMDSEHQFMDVFIMEVEDTIDTYKKMYLMANSDRIKNVISPNPNLPEVDYVPSRNYIINLRRRLLWKTQRYRKPASVVDPSTFLLGGRKELASVLSEGKLNLEFLNLES